MHTRQVVIIGAGPGGLAAAMLLASAGLRVTVLERLDRVGGRTSTLEADGFRFDRGPTFFMYPEVLRRIFRMCGRSLDEEVELIRLDPHYRLCFGSGETLHALPDPARLEREIARISPGDAPGVHRFFEDNRRKITAFDPIFRSNFDGLGDVMRLPRSGALSVLRPWLSVDGDLRRFFADPRIRLLFSFQSKYLGMSPFRCPSLFTILSFLEYEYGIFHPRGGCGAVSTAMARVASELGVEIRLSEPVTSLELDGHRPTAAVTRAGRYPCDALVINADFARAMTRLVPDALRRRWTDRKIAGKRFSCSTFMLYLGIDGREDLDHHTIYLSSDYRGNLDDIERGYRLSEDPSFYVANPCVTDPTMAPEGSSALYVLAPVPHQHPNLDWNREEAGFRSRILRQLEKIGLRDLERRIRFETRLTPDQWDRELEIHLGATFNLAHNLGQLLHLRPRNRFEDLESVYLVGGGTHPGSGLPVIFESAQITSRLVADDLGIRPAWNVAEVRAGPILEGTPGTAPTADGA
jgi:phytoene desaturase